MKYPDFVLTEQIILDAEKEKKTSYRYSLHIPLKRQGSKRYAVIMMNPSTADASKSDRTIDRIIRYIARNDADATEIAIVNLYPVRETYSKNLVLIEHKHRKNISKIKDILGLSDIVILGWGKPDKMRQERLHEIRYHHIAQEMLEICLVLDITPKIIEALREGLYPRHPGRIKYEANLVDHDVREHIQLLKKCIQKNTLRFELISAQNMSVDKSIKETLCDSHGPLIPTAVLIHVPDVPVGFEWYKRAFPDAIPMYHSDAGFAVLDLKGFSLEIVQADDKVGNGKKGTVIYWLVNDFVKSLANFEALGAKLYRGPIEIENGLFMCQVEDPYGNLIGLRG